MEFLYPILAAVFVSSISFIGIFLLIKQITSSSPLITALISFAAGSLIGDAFLHLLAEHIEAFGYTEVTVFGIFFGVVAMLLIEAYFHCSHDSAHEVEEAEHNHKHALAHINIIGDGLHNLLDGIAIAAAFLIDVKAGIATTIAITLHEIPQEIADAAILSYSGWKRKRILIVNFITALTAVVGVIIALLLNEVIENADKFFIPIVVGQFIYIALADLVPEIHKKAGVKKYFVEILAFVAGLGVMYALTLLE